MSTHEAHGTYAPTTGIGKWIDARMPLPHPWSRHPSVRRGERAQTRSACAQSPMGSDACCRAPRALARLAGLRSSDCCLNPAKPRPPTHTPRSPSPAAGLHASGGTAPPHHR